MTENTTIFGSSIQTSNLPLIRKLHWLLYGKAYRQTASGEAVVFRPQADKLALALAEVAISEDGELLARLAKNPTEKTQSVDGL